jgi:uncharacterized RDD family membrane protein YckC
MTESLSKSETKEIVTPYAFTVSAELLGKPLASPTRRGIAIIIDLFLISVLTSISAFIFAVFVALTFFRADVKLKQNANKENKNTWYYTRLLLRGSGAVIVFFIAYFLVQGFDQKETGINFSGEELGLQIAQRAILHECDVDINCVHNKGLELAKGFADSDITPEAFNEGMENALADSSLSPEAISNTLVLYQDAFKQERLALENLSLQTPNDISQTELVIEGIEEVQTPKEPEPEPEPEKISSVIERLEILMSDLGLGLGWAALYFSVFTAWANGQTIGKKLCGIKVVKLDGKAPNLWESFGRYGGYGAGFATGLLGFLQLYWDPNRQAIQDKISETLVLRNKKH